MARQCGPQAGDRRGGLVAEQYCIALHWMGCGRFPAGAYYIRFGDIPKCFLRTVTVNAV